ncbi:endonuclease domain-containing protein [Actinomadura verrucosospora]|uniref:endonuclease domain-containing protein n=1 Tax=Actinomadura verrucosospora TaxID=46165 RepID=UPI003D1880DF
MRPGRTAEHLEDQNGMCALCINPPRVIDHDHTNGLIRGLLCWRCTAASRPAASPPTQHHRPSANAHGATTRFAEPQHSSPGVGQPLTKGRREALSLERRSTLQAGQDMDNARLRRRLIW